MRAQCVGVYHREQMIFRGLKNTEAASRNPLVILRALPAAVAFQIPHPLPELIGARIVNVQLPPTGRLWAGIIRERMPRIIRPSLKTHARE